MKKLTRNQVRTYYHLFKCAQKLSQALLPLLNTTLNIISKEATRSFTRGEHFQSSMWVTTEYRIFRPEKARDMPV